MLIERLKLNNFRNYEMLDIRFNDGFNVICGDNAQGKTSVIEAIFLCAFGRSHRTPRDNELIGYGCAGGYVGVDMKNLLGSDAIEIKLREGEYKKVFINKQQTPRVGELIGLLNVALFSPEDLLLVKGAPSERRRFMDMELSQLRPAYFYTLQRYNRALKQRNALLKDDGHDCRAGMLSMWDEQLAEQGMRIMTARRDFIDKISTVARDIHKLISGNKEELEIVYKPDIPLDESNEGIFSTLMEALECNASEDIRRGYTSVGPHRDDIVIKINGADLRTFGSQGQQRTAALSMKLSELAIIREEKNEPPVLLLDDVFSELDGTRQNLLLDAARGCQCFLTCASIGGLKNAGIKDVRLYECVGGTLH